MVNRSLKYFENIGKTYTIPLSYGMYEEDEIKLDYNGPLPTWFIFKYWYVFQKIAQFNMLYENIKRRFYVPGKDEIKSLCYSRIFSDEKFLKSFNDESVITTEKICLEYLKDNSLKEAVDLYWDMANSQSFNENFYFDEPWTEEPCPPPSSNFTNDLRYVSQKFNEIYHTVGTMRYILDFYAHTIPYFKGIEDERFIRELKEAYHEIEEMSVLAHFKEKRKVAKSYQLPKEFKQFIVPKNVTSDDQIYLLGFQHKRANFVKFQEEVMYMNRFQYASLISYYKQILDNFEKNGLDLFYAYDLFQLKISTFCFFNKDNELPLPKTYNSNVMAIVRGALETYIAYCEFMEELLWKDENCDEDREFIANLKIEIFLIRCLGLSMVENVEKKIIVTSIINYKEALKKYIENGFTIKFIPALVISDGKLMEVDEQGDFHKLKRGKAKTKYNDKN